MKINDNSHRRLTHLAVVALLSLLVGFPALAERPRQRGLRSVRTAPVARQAVTPAAAATPAPAPTPTEVGAITGLVVTDVDPSTILREDGRYAGPKPFLGPFDAHDTLNVYVVAALDQARLGDEPFDQLTVFHLPDGSVYESRITPVDPQGSPGQTVERAELAPNPVRVSLVAPLAPLAANLPSAAGLDAAGDQVFTNVILPVSGTWITKHNLYGTWTAEVSLVRNGEVFATAQTSFELGNF